MFKSGLIIGAVMLIIGGVLAFLFPLCIPCLALFAGAGAGYLAGQFDKPRDNGNAIRGGATAGAVGGVGALFGHIFGGMASIAVVDPQQTADMLRQFGLDPGTVSTGPAYYGGAFLASCCFGLFEVALMAGLGALGGMLWWQMTGKNQSGAGMMPPSMPA
jgi:hypothetical protein